MRMVLQKVRCMNETLLSGTTTLLELALPPINYTLHKFALLAKRNCGRYKYTNKGYINVTSNFSKDM